MYNALMCVTLYVTYHVYVCITYTICTYIYYMHIHILYAHTYINRGKISMIRLRQS